MEQSETLEIKENAQLPIVEPKWDPERAARRKVRVIKVPNGQDPMKEKTVFEFGGFVYLCYAVKTRGRYMIRCLGMAELASDTKLIDPGPAAKALSDSIDSDVMADLKTDVKPPTHYEAGKLLDSAENDLIKENTEGGEVNGQSRGPDEAPDP